MIFLGMSALVSALGVWILLPVLRARVLDVPNERSSHQAPVPRAGGIAVMVAIAAAVAAASLTGDDAVASWHVIAAVALLAAIGLIDDLRSLPARVRLAGQLIAAILIASQAPHHVSWVASAAAAVAVIILVVGYVNAFNFMDGVNAISALNAIVAGGWYAWLGHHYDARAGLVLGLAIAGGALGFLPWNAPKARLFLGDCGSYGVGGAIAAAGVLVWSAGASVSEVLAPVLVYLADTGWVLVKRARGRRPLAVAHREHVYQRLVDKGRWPHLAVAALSALCAAICCVVAWVAPPVLSAGLLAAVVVAYLVVPELSTRAGKQVVA